MFYEIVFLGYGFAEEVKGERELRRGLVENEVWGICRLEYKEERQLDRGFRSGWDTLFLWMHFYLLLY